MKQYCVYCAGCISVDGELSCDTLDKGLTLNQAQRENHCGKFNPSPMGHVITGRQYRPQRWRHLRIYSSTGEESGR